MEPTKKLFKITDGKLQTATLAELAEENASLSTTPQGVDKTLHIHEYADGFNLCKWIAGKRIVLNSYDNAEDAEDARMEVLIEQFCNSEEGMEWSDSEAEAWDWYNSMSDNE